MKDLIKKILKEGSDNEFDWVRNIEPISVSEIGEELSSLREFGFYIHKPENSRLVKTIYNLGLDTNGFKTLVGTLHDFAYSVYEAGREEGQQEVWGDARAEGYDEGYDEGQKDMRAHINSEAQEKYEEGYDKGFDEGYNEGLIEGYQKGYEEGSEETYHRAFEEGRAYESGIDVEDLERRESGFNPKEYDEDYDDIY